MYNIRALLLLTATYLALTANLQPSNIIMGLLLSSLILLLLRPATRAVGWQVWPSSTWAMLRYILVLAYDLIVSGIQVARIVLDPALPIQQGNIAIPTNFESETGQALSAHAITLTPGEMVVEISDEGVMYTHVLDASHAQDNMAEAQKMREELVRQQRYEGPDRIQRMKLPYRGRGSDVEAIPILGERSQMPQLAHFSQVAQLLQLR